MKGNFSLSETVGHKWDASPHVPSPQKKEREIFPFFSSESRFFFGGGHLPIMTNERGKKIFLGQAPNLPHEEGEKVFFHPLYHLLSGIKDRRPPPLSPGGKKGERERTYFSRMGKRGEHLRPFFSSSFLPTGFAMGQSRERGGGEIISSIPSFPKCVHRSMNILVCPTLLGTSASAVVCRESRLRMIETKGDRHLANCNLS